MTANDCNLKFFYKRLNNFNFDSVVLEGSGWELSDEGGEDTSDHVLELVLGHLGVSKVVQFDGVRFLSILEQLNQREPLKLGKLGVVFIDELPPQHLPARAEKLFDLIERDNLVGIGDVAVQLAVAFHIFDFAEAQKLRKLQVGL